MKDLVLTYKGPRRPLYHCPNFPDIYMEDGDIFTIRGEHIYKSGLFDYSDRGVGHRYFTVISNLIPYNFFGIPSKDECIQIFKEMLNGKLKTVLEHRLIEYKKFEKFIPKRNFSAAHYNFSNQFRPISKFEYDKGRYNFGGGEEYTPSEMSRYLCGNLFVVLPKGMEECDAKTFELLYNEQKSKRESKQSKL